MTLLKYLQKEGPLREYNVLLKKETEQPNERVWQVLMTARKKCNVAQRSYADHTTNIGSTPSRNGC